MAKPSTDIAPNAESTASIGPEIFNPVLVWPRSSKQKESVITPPPACSWPPTLTRALGPGTSWHDACPAALTVTGYPSTSITALDVAEVTTPPSDALAPLAPGRLCDTR